MKEWPCQTGPELEAIKGLFLLEAGISLGFLFSIILKRRWPSWRKFLEM